MASMTELPLIDIRSLLLERDDMDAGVVQQLKTALAESPAQHRTLKEVAETLEEQVSLGDGRGPARALKLGIASYLLGRTERCAELLADAKGPLAQFYLGLALIDLGRYDDAISALSSAASSGYAAPQVKLHTAAALRGMGRYDEALEQLQSLDDYVRNSAEYLFQYGATLDAKGEEEAVECFEKALDLDPRHIGALFQLGLSQ